MSIGNLKDSGNQGNNFPWQLKVLQGLQQVLDANDACCKNTNDILSSIGKILEGAERKPNISSSTTTGTVAAGAFSISVANVGSAAGTLGGVSIPAGTTINWSAEFNNYLAAIGFDATGTTFIITTITAP